MQPLSNEEIEACKARRPAAAPEVVEREAAEYAALVSDSFMRPPPGLLFDTAESEAGIPDAPAAAPPGDEARLAELGHRLFNLAEPISDGEPG